MCILTGVFRNTDIATKDTENILQSTDKNQKLEMVKFQDKQQSTNPILARTLVELNQTMRHMAMMLSDLWQHSQDKDEPIQQTEVS